MPRDVSLSDSKCRNGGQKLVKDCQFGNQAVRVDAEGYNTPYIYIIYIYIYYNTPYYDVNNVLLPYHRRVRKKYFSIFLRYFCCINYNASKLTHLDGASVYLQ